MRTFILIALVIMFASLPMPSWANSTFTRTPADNDLWDLPHDHYYIWKITAPVPSGEKLDFARLSISGIYNRYSWERNVLFVRLFSPENVKNLVFGGDRIFIGNDNQQLHYNDLAQYGGQEIYPDGQWEQNQQDYIDYDGPQTKDNLFYTFNDEELDLLNSYIQPNGTLKLAIGFDADCWYRFMTPNCRITFTGTTVPVVPAPGAVFLGGIGVCIVGWLRGRKTL